MASIIRSTANRAVHLRIVPRPSNLGESREILRLISQFGEVEYFKNLKYDHLSAPNAALVIYKNEDAAQSCLRGSPIRFRMGRAFAGETAFQPVDESASRVDRPSQNPFDQAALTSTTASQDHQPEQTQTPSQPPPPQLHGSQLYQIQAHPARVNFRDQINAGQYHGPFAIDTKSVAQGDLSKSVPLPGLSCVDWRKEDKPWRIINAERFREHESSNRRKSLRELYEEAPQEKGIAENQADAVK